MKIGILGGTFDPVHQAHVAMGLCALRQFRLDKVFFVLAARPPHKKGHRPRASARHRFAMLKLALAPSRKMVPSDIEMKRRGPSFTYKTLRAMKKKYPAAQFYLILGQDSYEGLDRWHHSGEIKAMARFLIAKRSGIRAVKKAGTQTSWIRMRLRSVSSSSIRKGDLATDDLDPRVSRYIRRHHLYGNNI